MSQYADDLIDNIRRAAKTCIANGETSRELYAKADEEDRTGFSISAPYTRLLASAVRKLEEKNAA